MNIGIICYPTYGGSGVVATELGKALGQEGHQVHFISYDQPARLDFFNQNLFYHEVTVSKYPLFRYPPYEIALASKIVDIVQVAKLDVLHVHYAIPHAAAALMARQILQRKGIYIPVITTLHGTDITLVGKDPTYEPVVSYSINESDAVTSVSESLKNDTYKHFEVSKPIEVIPNFIDFGRFSKKPKEHFKKAIAPNGERILVHTSNFRKVKRIEDVVEVFHLVKQQIPSRLLLVGDGPERFQIEKVCREYELDNDVTFLGKQDAVEEILSVCDLFLLTSETESFGLSALEAMACEVPVISSNSGGLPEVNLNGFSGYTCEVGDTRSMAEKALHILGPELETFKKQAFEQSRKFDLKIILPVYERLYEKVIKNAAYSVTP